MSPRVLRRDDTEAIARIETEGTWEREIKLLNPHYSYDLWNFDGELYKIYKDSAR